MGASLWHSRHLEAFTTALTGQLVQAETLALSGENRRAETLIRQARDQWLSQNTYLHVTLRHGDTDQIQIGFDEALQLLRTGDWANMPPPPPVLTADRSSDTRPNSSHWKTSFNWRQGRPSFPMFQLMRE